MHAATGRPPVRHGDGVTRAVTRAFGPRGRGGRAGEVTRRAGGTGRPPVPVVPALMPWPRSLRQPSATGGVGRLAPSAEQEDEGADQDAAHGPGGEHPPGRGGVMTPEAGVVADQGDRGAENVNEKDRLVPTRSLDRTGGSASRCSPSTGPRSRPNCKRSPSTWPAPYPTAALEGTGHYRVLERPDAFLRVLLDAWSPLGAPLVLRHPHDPGDPRRHVPPRVGPREPAGQQSVPRHRERRGTRLHRTTAPPSPASARPSPAAPPRNRRTGAPPARTRPPPPRPP